MTNDEIVEKGLNYIRTHADEHAKAKAKRVYLQHYRKSKKSLLMRDAEVSGVTITAKQDRDARCHPEYIELLEALREATEIEERCAWFMKLAEFEFEKWRTKEASRRQEKSRYGA